MEVQHPLAGSPLSLASALPSHIHVFQASVQQQETRLPVNAHIVIPAAYVRSRSTRADERPARMVPSVSKLMTEPLNVSADRVYTI